MKKYEGEQNGKLNCDCVKKMDETLEPHNAGVDTAMMFSMTTMHEWVTMILPVVKLDPKKRSRLPKIAMNYCPMCGTKTGSPPAKAGEPNGNR